MDRHVKSAYIHIPFCKSKCKYCSFVSGTDFGKKTGYLYSLLKEIDYYYTGDSLDTLYIGGGTPSVFDTEDIKKLADKFNFSENAEKTIEVNPNDITSEYADGLMRAGFNRISIGAQSFDDNILNIIGRRHSKSEIYRAVEILKRSGFDNISLDLIYGLPEQDIEKFKYDLNEVINLDVQHVSLYGLKIDEGCYFYNDMPQNLPDDDLQADMYLLACEVLKGAGFNHYEVSNFSKTGRESRHNSNYWMCGEYYGFGLSAHGYVDGVRYSNVKELEEYLDSPTSHEYGKFLTEKEKLEEKIFLGFRLTQGLDIQAINFEFNIDFEEKYKKVLDKYLKTSHIEKTDKGYKLSDNKTNNGFLLSNIILSDFI